MTVSDKARIYALKRRYGQRVIILHRISADVDLSSGLIQDTKTEVPIQRAIVLNHALKPKFIYDIGYLAANKNFTYGGEHNQITMTVIIDKRDIPATVTLASTGEIKVNDKVYQFENCDFDPMTECYIIRVVASGELASA